MLNPLFLPQNLHHYVETATDEELLKELQKNPYDLIQFFEYSIDDETWSENHPLFTEQAVKLITNWSYKESISIENAKRAAKSIQKHIAILKPYLPLNIEIKVKDQVFLTNSLLLMTSSGFFYHLVVKACRDRNSKTLFFEDVPGAVFSVIDEYLIYGFVENLWKKLPDEILKVMDQAAFLELIGLVQDCEVVLKRYISRETVFDMIILAHQRRLELLKNGCIDFVDTLDYGLRFEKTDQTSLALEFTDFKLRTLEIFDKVKNYLTHLIIGGSLIEEIEFSRVIHQCPQLIGLDISRSYNFSPYLNDIPPDLRELDISKCPWLNPEYLRKIFQIAPHIEKLKLNSNVHLNYAAWGELNKLKNLTSLDLSRCQQLTDQDLRIILQSSPALTNLNLDSCQKLTDYSLFDLPKYVTNLLTLNLSNLLLSNTSLLEIAFRSRNLHTLILSHCPNITDKGVLDTVRHAPSLETIDLSGNHFSQHTLESLQMIHPGIKVK